VSQGYGRGAGRAYPDFDRVFIEQMIPHQLIGVRTASIIQKGIVDPELRGLYVAIRGRAQSGESDRMARWNRQWWHRLRQAEAIRTAPFTIIVISYID
jgi:uncharacterized protein (DUF305 family)